MANDRFMRKGTTKFYFVPTITNLTGATVSQITAGVNISPQVAEVSGFSFTNNPIAAPDMDSAFVSQISGEDTVEASTTTMYDLSDNTTIKEALAKGEIGYMVIFYSGIAGATPAVGDDYEVWPVEVASNSRIYSAGNEAAQYTVGWTLTDPPVEGTVVT
jgi:hypothetical protein